MKPFFKIFTTFSFPILLTLSTQAQGLVGIYFSKDPSGETNYPMILGIVDDSPAEKADLKIGQRIKTINGRDADMSKVDQKTVLDWIKGLTGSSLELLVTEPNDISKTKVVKFNRGPAPTATNRLTNVAQVSQYFPMRIWACLKALEDREEGLTLTPIESGLTYNDKKVSRWRVSDPFMNEIQEGIYESHIDEDGNLEREVHNDKLSYVLIEGIENDFLADKYFKETKAALKKALRKEIVVNEFGTGHFSDGEESVEKQHLILVVSLVILKKPTNGLHGKTKHFG